MDEKIMSFAIMLGAVVLGLFIYGFVSKYIPAGL